MGRRLANGVMECESFRDVVMKQLVLIPSSNQSPALSQGEQIEREGHDATRGSIDTGASLSSVQLDALF